MITAVLLGVSGFWASVNMDFNAYWFAADRLTNGGLLYFYTGTDTAAEMPFLYPPVAAVFFTPFTLVGLKTGALIWTCLHAVGFVVILRLIREMTKEFSRPTQFLAFAFCLGVLPICDDFLWGQVGFLLLILVLGGVVASNRKMPILAGILFASAAHLKLLPIAILPILIVSGRKREAKSMAIALVAMVALLLPITIYAKGFAAGVMEPIHLHLDFIEFALGPALQNNVTGGLPQSAYPNSSIRAILARLFSDSTLSLRGDETGPLLFSMPKLLLTGISLLVPVSMYVGVLCVARRRRGQIGFGALVGLGLLSAFFANTLFWYHHRSIYLLLLPMLLWIIANRKRGWLAAVFSIGIVGLYEGVLLTQRLTPLGIEIHWQFQIGLWGFDLLTPFVLWGVCFISLLRGRRTSPNNDKAPTAALA